MKSLVSALIVSVIASPAFASQVSCEQTVSISVSQMLKEERPTEVLRRVTEVEQTGFTELQIFHAFASADGESIPYSSSWLVVARKGPQATCTVESVVLDIAAE